MEPVVLEAKCPHCGIKLRFTVSTAPRPVPARSNPPHSNPGPDGLYWCDFCEEFKKASEMYLRGHHTAVCIKCAPLVL